MSVWTVFLLTIGAVILALAAVSIDRLNFPQKPFTPKTLPKGQNPSRDRTGAHIVSDDSQEET